jgi:hypothetical protein
MLCEDLMDRHKWRWLSTAHRVPVAVQRFDVWDLMLLGQPLNEMVTRKDLGHLRNEGGIVVKQRAKVVLWHRYSS